MEFLRIIWDMEDDEDGNVQHIALHGITPDEVEQIIYDAHEEQFSRSSGRPLVFGYLPDGRCITVIFDWVDDDTIYPVTAYETEG